MQLNHKVRGPDYFQELYELYYVIMQHIEYKC